MPNPDDDFAPGIPTRAAASGDILVTDDGKTLFVGETGTDTIELDLPDEEFDFDDTDDSDEGTDSDEFEEPVEGFPDPREDDDPSADRDLPDDFEL